MRDDSRGRIIFDVSTSMRWMGPPVGIVRVERKLAAWARENVPGTVFAFFDPDRLAYCEVTREVMEFLDGEAALDTLGLTDRRGPAGAALTASRRR